MLKRAEREEGFLEAVTKLSGEAEHQLRLNLALDIYQEIFPSLEEEEGVEAEEAEEARLDTVAVLRDPAPGPGTSARPVSCVSWGRGHGAESSLAVAYSSPELLASLQFGSRDGLIISTVSTLISTILHKYLHCRDGFVFAAAEPGLPRSRLASSSCITSLHTHPRKFTMMYVFR